jgi:predicted NAD/FAD-dependent oxidoreductase
MKTRIAIIGAGISGLTLAQALNEKNDVTVFEKARGVGGRMSTRYADPFYFDHGTQYFTARTTEFQAFVASYMEQGIIDQWQGSVITFDEGKDSSKRLWFEPHYVACPNMNSLCKALAKGVELKVSIEVAPLAQRAADGWHLTDIEENPLGVFDIVISTAPPAQTCRLFKPYIPEQSPMQGVDLKGCYALMLGFKRKWNKPWIAARVLNSPVSWISVNSSKPQRNPEVTSIVVHTDNDWSQAHIDDDMQEAQRYLAMQFENITGIATGDADYLSTHRWRYAIADEHEKTAPYLNKDIGLAAVSDWASASRIEDVWLAARQLAAMI